MCQPQQCLEDGGREAWPLQKWIFRHFVQDYLTISEKHWKNDWNNADEDGRTDERLFSWWWATAIGASTRSSFDKSLAQILHHRFCIAVRRLLSVLFSFPRIVSLTFGRNGNISRILKAFSLPSIILASYWAVYHEHNWKWFTKKPLWGSSVLLACSLDPTKIGASTISPWFIKSNETFKPQQHMILGMWPQNRKHEPNNMMVWMRIKKPDVHNPLAPWRL